MASIQVPVLVQYALPTGVMCLFGLGFTLLVFWYLGRRLCHNFWFERSLFVYGWSTGVVATSITLLRVVDPAAEVLAVEEPVERLLPAREVRDGDQDGAARPGEAEVPVDDGVRVLEVLDEAEGGDHVILPTGLPGEEVALRGPGGAVTG